MFFEIVELLIRAGADPNLPPRSPSYRGLTPLILSIVNGTEEISEFLINSLCNVNQKVEDGETNEIVRRNSLINKHLISFRLYSFTLQCPYESTFDHKMVVKKWC